jgi:hypothetical protein
VIYRAKKGDITKGEFVFWSVIWLAVIIIALIPSFATPMAEFLGIGRAVDVMIYLSILVLFYLVFRMYVKLEKTEQEITQLVRKIALKKK